MSVKTKTKDCRCAPVCDFCIYMLKDEDFCTAENTEMDRTDVICEKFACGLCGRNYNSFIFKSKNEPA